ncbi:hypothetical protein ACQPZF_00955 [Actinosynnema sp. CS-041913]|uniref:hypothetical protein n=1 Tax=Actinosynnema sp. CS-041913 TaxID=3239917 RepID=UPI003D8D569C
MTATFYDRRAERTAAQAQAVQAQAAAEQTRAQTALTLVQVDQARVQAAADFADRRARREQEARDAARARRRATRRAVAARLPDWLLSALWATVIVSPITIAWRSQQDFAATTLHLGWWGWLFPLAVESGAWVCAFEAHRRRRAGLPVGALPTWMWVLGGVAAAIQLLHNATDHGVVVGVVLAAMSLLGVLLHHVRQSADHAAAEGRSGAQLRRALWRRLRYPRLSWAAAAIHAARTDTPVEAAWRAAWVDRYGVGPDSTRRDRRLARVIVRHQRRADRRAAREGALTILGGVIVPVTLTPPDTTAAAGIGEVDPPRAAPDAPGGETAIVQREHGSGLSAKAAELLPAVQAAITAGDLPARPSARAILARFGGSTKTASEVRDALTDRQEVTP